MVIDGQNDFVLPNGALPVTGAVDDMKRVVEFIKNNMDGLNGISCTLDSHHTLDISHPAWWMDKNGNIVPPFTVILPQDLLEGKYTARTAPQWSNKYVNDLATQGEFVHFVWPYHCLIGTTGHALYADLAAALKQFEETKGVPVHYVTKGENQYTEHFGAFRANIEIPQDPSTQLNQRLIKYLMENDDVYLAGEASSHCVANTLKQAVNEVPGLASKLIILEDCMSAVPGGPVANGPSFAELAQPIYDDAKAKGVRFAKSTDVVLDAALV